MFSSQCLVTGAAGFIGSHLCERLIEDNFTVLGIDSFHHFYGRKQKEFNLQNLKKSSNFKFIEANINDTALLARCIKKNQIIFHLAAQANVRHSLSPAAFIEYHQINVEGTMNMLQAAKATEVERFIFISSSSVYGHRKTVPTGEDSPRVPQSPYGVTKLAGEHYTRMFAELFDLPIVILRPFSISGARQRPDMAIAIFAQAIMNKQPVNVFGDGTQKRDYTHVDDMVNAIIAASEKNEALGEDFNIGGGNLEPVIGLIKILEDEIGHDAELNYYPSIKGEADITHANIEKARKFLGFEPKLSLRKAIRDYLDWFDTFQERS